MSRPEQITLWQFELLATGYGRQSTFGQVERNTGSTDYQRGQLRYPREWGWPEERIRWFDDFGLSGSSPDHRPGYLELRALIVQGKVGLVCVSDLTRLGRNAAELLLFIRDCATHSVLLSVDGRLLDPRNPSDWLMNALEAILGEHGGNYIRDNLQHGRKAKLEKGTAVSFPPVGYDQAHGKSWVITADLAVRSAIATVFRIFFEKRTLHATAEELQRLEQQIPRRKPGHPIRWRRASTHVLADMFANPNYTPDYYYRRRVDDPTKPRSERGRRRVRPARPEEMTIIRDHHEGYITREQWREIREIFDRNSWTRDHAPMGDGWGLVQGLPRCPTHRNRLLNVHYKRGQHAGPRSFHYHCKGDWETCGRTCGRISGARLDEVVAAAVLERLSPPTVADVRAVLDEFVSDEKAEVRRRDIERARVRQRVADLEAKLDAVGSENTAALRRVSHQLQQAEDDLERITHLDDKARAEMLREWSRIVAEAEAIAPEVELIWNASSTTQRDRKELVRTLVRTIAVASWGPEVAQIRISWVDEAPTTVCEIVLPGGAERLVERGLVDGLSFAAIADALNVRNSRTRKGRRWGENEVRALATRLRDRQRRSGLDSSVRL